jgi:hypothetical protein
MHKINRGNSKKMSPLKMWQLFLLFSKLNIVTDATQTSTQIISELVVTPGGLVEEPPFPSDKFGS